MIDDPFLTETTQLVLNVIIVLIAMGVVAAAGTLGWFSERTFTRSAERSGRLFAHDLTAIAGCFILGFIAASGVIALAVSFGMEQPALTALAVIVSPLSAAPALIYAYMVLRRRLPGGLRGWGFSLNDFKVAMVWGPIAFLLTLPVVVVGAGIVAELLTAFDQPVPEIAHQTLQVIADSRPQPLVLGIIGVGVVLLAPFFEEVLFRGLVQTILGQRSMLNGRWRAILATSAIFALIHIPAIAVTAPDEPIPAGGVSGIEAQISPVVPDDVPPFDVDEAEPPASESEAGFAVAWPALVMLFLLSVAMGFAYEKTGSLWVPIVMHMLFNAYNVVMLLLMHD